MQGSLREHEERMETKKSQMIDNTELKMVSAEFESLMVDTNINYRQELKEKFEGHENAVLAIRIKFADIKSLGNDSCPSTTITQSEKEYLEEVKQCLDEGGDIPSSERRLLERFREKPGISPERAKEIEKL